nr:unnamed protein product [Digitaria exilis]
MATLEMSRWCSNMLGAGVDKIDNFLDDPHIWQFLDVWVEQIKIAV